MRYSLALLALLAAPVCAQTGLKPGRKYTTVERLAPERLATVRTARESFAKLRKQLPPVGVYNDYPAVLHIHAEDAPHTLGKRAEVLAAAKAAGIRVVMFSDHNGPKPDTWQGIKDGVLFFAGAENGGKHELVYANPAPGVRFHSHVEGQMDASADGWDGMEIYNRHSDAEDDLDLLAYLKDAAKSPERLQALADLMKSYPDEIFGAGCDYWPQIFARWDAILATRPFAGIAANDAHQNTVLGPLTLDPYAVAFRNTSTHVLAREFNDKAIQDSLRAGRAYVSHDWLCDPSGFAFIAVNNLGVYQMGDTIPMAGTTRLVARAPVPAQWKIFHNGKLVHTQTAGQVAFQAPEPGAYRAEAWLELDGEQRPWIYSNAIRLEKPSLGALTLPAQALDPGIEAEKDIEYTQGAPEDAAKHKLDIYRPAGAKNAPVLFFVHGGAWRQGDRGQYPFFGNRFAKAGYVVVTVSYRLSPKYPHPAHIEDVASAFAWTVRNIAQHGGDPARIMIAGHSAGGHLVALLAANPEWLAAHGLISRNIRGVMALSGVYDVTGPLMEGSSVFPTDADVRRRASSVKFVKAGLPPFLITYCQWDYAALPQQALMLHEALRSAGSPAELVYVPGENHISEMTNIPKPADPTATAMLRFMEGLR